MWRCWNLFPWPYPTGGFGLVVILLGLAAVLWAVRSRGDARTRRRGARADREDALRLLDQRLAEGRISQEDYEQLRRSVQS